METDESLGKDTEEVGCFGLAAGLARNLKTHKPYHASTATKADGPFYCSQCYSDAVLRKCKEKRDHYAHKARLSPVLRAGESELHKSCKEEICIHLKELFPDGNWETEREISKKSEFNIPALRPDISGRINDQPVVIEIQASELSIPKIIARTQAYAKWKIALLWIIPLREPLGDLPFRPRLYERYIHGIYYGRTYYWTHGQGLTLKPVHYGIARRFIDYSEWHDEYGEIQTAGGYNKAYKVLKTPEYGPDIHIVDSFKVHNRESFIPDNEKKEVPECLTWQDNLQYWWNKKSEEDFKEECLDDDYSNCH